MARKKAKGAGKKKDAKEKPDDAKEKPDDAKPAGDEGEKIISEKTPLEKIMNFFQTPLGLFLAIVITIFLVFLAVQAVIMCLNEWEKTADLRHAMQLVKTFMMRKDSSYEDKDVKIRYKLNHDWMAHKDAIYLFVVQPQNWTESRKFCMRQNAKLLRVENAEEEEFIEGIAYGKHNSYWIGAIKESNKWIWLDDKTEVKLLYWAEKSPRKEDTTPDQPFCMRLKNDCTIPRKCWTDIRCNYWARSICKIKPLKKWMN
nr:C-type lectin domain family 4 member C-like isoform X2 [Pogona vitticeps]